MRRFGASFWCFGGCYIPFCLSCPHTEKLCGTLRRWHAGLRIRVQARTLSIIQLQDRRWEWCLLVIVIFLETCTLAGAFGRSSGQNMTKAAVWGEGWRSFSEPWPATLSSVWLSRSASSRYQGRRAVLLCHRKLWR